MRRRIGPDGLDDRERGGGEGVDSFSTQELLLDVLGFGALFPPSDPDDLVGKIE